VCGVFFDVEADFGFRRRLWWLREGAELPKNVTERGVIDEQSLVNLGQPLREAVIRE